MTDYFAFWEAQLSDPDNSISLADGTRVRRRCSHCGAVGIPVGDGNFEWLRTMAMPDDCEHER